MKRYVIITFTCFLLYSCSGSDSFTVSNIIDGNTLELKNGVTVSLIEVPNNQDNIQLLQTLLNDKIYLYNEQNELIETLDDNKVTAFVYNSNGDCINLLLKNLSGEIKKDNPIVNEIAPPIVTEDITPPGSSKSLSQLYKELKPSIFIIYTAGVKEIHQGTGFFIKESGIGVSNYHVFKGTIQGKEIIRTEDGREYKIKEILSKNAAYDYIVFSIEARENEIFPYLSLSKRQPEIGEECFAIGNPEGLEQTLSKGIVSQIRDNGNIIQTTTEITHGSSGGPLFNMIGEVIGITFAGLGEANLNFAINTNLIKYDP